MGPEIPQRKKDTVRIVVKLDERIPMPRDDRLEKYFDKLDGDEWRKIRHSYPDLTVRRVFTAVPLERLKELADDACRCDSNYQPPDFASYFEIEGPWNRKDAAAVARILRAWKNVKRAYVAPAAGNPGTVTPGSNPRFNKQGYLQAAPRGIDAVFAWEQPGGDGKDQDFIDLEQGWTVHHNDLIAKDIERLYGPIDDNSRRHGTSVLGIVCAVDNNKGGIGIAPNVTVKVVSSYPDNVADAILAASQALAPGGVLLIEAQALGVGDYDPLPVEVGETEFEMIRQATTRGITVVECAGNGTTNLDDFQDDDGQHVLKLDGDGSKDSGAIIVGAANAVSTDPARGRFKNSNYGKRVNCYAWGEDINTADSTNVSPFAVNVYTEDFRETSGAGAIVAGAALCLQGVFQKLSGGARLNASQMRAMLSNPATGTPSHDPSHDRIGVMPNLRKIIQSDGFAANANAAKNKLTKTGGP